MIKTVNKRMIENGVEPYLELENGYKEGELDSFFIDDENKIFVAEVNGVVVGFLSVCMNKELDYLYLDDYCVATKFRGNGIGSRLLNLAEEYALKFGINNINAHVESSNYESRNFYERKGFSVLSDDGNRLAINKKVLAEEVKYVK
jgi:ribosomal protein S18 acetylase RimI-like enzyme